MCIVYKLYLSKAERKKEKKKKKQWGRVEAEPKVTFLLFSFVSHRLTDCRGIDMLKGSVVSRKDLKFWTWIRLIWFEPRPCLHWLCYFGQRQRDLPIKQQPELRALIPALQFLAVWFPESHLPSLSLHCCACNMGEGLFSSAGSVMSLTKPLTYRRCLLSSVWCYHFRW